MERLSLIVAEVEANGGCYILPDDVSLFEVAMIIQEAREPHVVLEVVEPQAPDMLEDPELLATVQCRVMMEHACGKPSAWVGHALVKKVMAKKPSVPEAMTFVLDAVRIKDADFLREVVTNPVTMPDFLGWDLWTQRIAARHLVREEGMKAFVPYDPRVRPALMFYVGLGLGQKARNHLALSMMESIGLPSVDDGEIGEYAGLLIGNLGE
ncbi:hypothetical protein [Desulfatibacillum alkenivorans]|nr:hypothetical protein [Desulfatibacillum alkenivorans]